MQGVGQVIPPRLNLTPGAHSPVNRSPRLPYPRISTPSWQSPDAPLQQVPPKLLQLPTGAQPCRCHPRIRPSAGSFGGRDHGVRRKARSAGPLPEFPAAAPAHLTAARRDLHLCRRTRARRGVRRNPPLRVFTYGASLGKAIRLLLGWARGARFSLPPSYCPDFPIAHEEQRHPPGKRLTQPPPGRGFRGWLIGCFQGARLSPPFLCTQSLAAV